MSIAIAIASIVCVAVRTVCSETDRSVFRPVRAKGAVDVYGKKELTPAAGTLWRRIESPILSNDGKWVAYCLTSIKNDNELVVRSTETDKEFRIWRRLSLDSADEIGSSNPEFTADSRFLIFTISPKADSVKAIRDKNNGLLNSALPTLAIMSLDDGRITSVSNVSTFTLPKGSGRYVGYFLENSPSQRYASIVAKTLVLRDLSMGREMQIAEVSHFKLDDAGRYLAYTVSSANPVKNGVYVRHLEEGQITTLLSGPGDYSGLVFDRTGNQLGFLSNHKDVGEQSPGYSLYLATAPLVNAEAVVKVSDLKESLRISPEAGVQFTSQGNAIKFEVNPSDSGRVVVAADSQQAIFDLYHWKEANPQTKKDIRPQSGYLCVYHIAERQWVQLGRESIPSVMLSDDARYAVGINQGPYMLQEEWGDSAVDVYILDTFSGKASLFRRGLRSGETFKVRGNSPIPIPIRVSPSGRYLMYFENRSWFSYDLERGSLTNLTGALLPDTHFETERFRHPRNRLPYPIGVAGWMADGRRVLIYDRNDVWEIDLAGAAAPRNLTGRAGTRSVFRVWSHDFFRATRFRTALRYPIQTTQSLILTAYNRDTQALGLWRLKLGSDAKPEPLLVNENANVTLVAKVEHAEQYLVTQESVREFPDLWVGSKPNELKKISNANSQQSEYRWGNVDVVEWTSDSGLPLKGLLFTPEDFDRHRKYRMIVDIYGGKSLFRHHYFDPIPSATFPVPMYLSKGYVVFQPDILSATHYPGEAALASVVSGVESILDRGFVDPARIGITGFSWGGFETNFIITRTNMFRCAVAGAGATNMLSGYGTVGWSAMYEKRAMMLGASPWERPDVYETNSPVLFADRVRTPLLMLNNEFDEIVPLTQGIEFYVALRRNGREVYLLNYKNEGHGLVKLANRLDYTQRMEQFFDHFLKDAPKPEWMVHGIPYSEKARNFGFEPAKSR